MFIPRLKGSENDVINKYDFLGKIQYRNISYPATYTTRKGKIVLITNISAWVQDVGFVYYKIDGVFHTTKTYHKRYAGFFGNRRYKEEVVFVTTKDFRKHIEENTICINNLKYKTLGGKRRDLQNFKNYLCNLPNSKIIVTAKL